MAGKSNERKTKRHQLLYLSWIFIKRNAQKVQSMEIGDVNEVLVTIGGIYGFSHWALKNWLFASPKKASHKDIAISSGIITANASLMILVFFLSSPWEVLPFIIFAFFQSFIYTVKDNTTKGDTAMLIIIWAVTTFVCTVEYNFYVLERLSALFAKWSSLFIACVP